VIVDVGAPRLIKHIEASPAHVELLDIDHFHAAPEGPVYQAGTLSGNPVTMAAGLAALNELRKSGFYEGLEKKSTYFFDRLGQICRASGHECCANSVASMGTLFFTGGPVTDFDSASQSDTAKYAAWFHGMLTRGIYLAPGKFECMFVSAAHSIADLDVVLLAAEETLRSMESTAA